MWRIAPTKKKKKKKKKNSSWFRVTKVLLLTMAMLLILTRRIVGTASFSWRAATVPVLSSLTSLPPHSRWFVSNPSSHSNHHRRRSARDPAATALLTGTTLCSTNMKTTTTKKQQDTLAIAISDAYDGGNIEFVQQEWMTDQHVVISLKIKPDPYTELEQVHHMVS